jgi:hypothetical protein
MMMRDDGLEKADTPTAHILPPNIHLTGEQLLDLGAAPKCQTRAHIIRTLRDKIKNEQKVIEECKQPFRNT